MEKEMKADTWSFMKSAVLEASFLPYEDGEGGRHWSEGEGNDLIIRAERMGWT